MVTYEAINTLFQVGTSIVTMFIAFVAIVATCHQQKEVTARHPTKNWVVTSF